MGYGINTCTTYIYTVHTYIYRVYVCIGMLYISTRTGQMDHDTVVKTLTSRPSPECRP